MGNTQTVTKAEFNKAMQVLHDNHVVVATANADKKKAVELAARPYEKIVEKAEAKIESAFEKVYAYAHENRDTLFVEGLKSITTAQGVIGFKIPKPSLVLKDGLKDKDIIEALQNARWHGASRFLTHKPTLNKQEIIAAREEADIMYKFEEMGAEVKQDEEFYYKPKK